MQDLRRGEEHRSQHLVHRFLRTVEALGPPPGTIVSMNLTNKSKHNPEGRSEYVGAAPHYDALRDTAAWLGLLWLFRFFVLKEPFPDFLKYEKLFKIPTYRSVTDAATEICESSYSEVWARFYADAEVIVGKLTHQCRRQGQQGLDDAGQDSGTIARMAGHQTVSAQQTRSQVEFYLTPPPLSCLAFLGWGDPDNPRAYAPSWIIAMGLLLDQLMTMFFPELMEQQRQVHAEYYACKTQKERLEGRWCSAKASIDSMVHDIRRALQMLASRPVCPDSGMLLDDQPTFRIKFASGELYELFKLDVFLSEEFKAFEAQMKEAQDNYFATAVVVEAPTRNEIDRVIAERVSRPLESLGRTMLFMRNALDTLHQSMNGGHTLTNGGPSGGPGPQNVSPQALAPGLPLLQPPLPAESDFLADGVTPRTRCRPRTQQTILQHENAQGSPEVRLRLCDSECTDLASYWRKWITEWRPLEQQQGTEWRNDRQIPGQKKDTKRSTWWNERKPIFTLIEHYLATGMREEDALNLANFTYCSAPPNKTTGKRAIKVVSAAFKKKLKELGIKRLISGRPKKQNGSAFAAAFPTTAAPEDMESSDSD
jgi:hypothetical protein